MLWGLIGCETVKPDLQAGMNSHQALDSLAKLTFVQCELTGPFRGQHYWDQRESAGKEFGSLLTILGTSIVTKGVDLLGEKLKAASEKKTRSIEAQANFFQNEEIGCVQFRRGKIGLKAAMLPAIAPDGKDGLNRQYVDFRVTEFYYGETLDKKTSGVRGIAITFEVKHPDREEAISRSIAIGNVAVGAKFESRFDSTPFVSEYLQNPFARTPVTNAEKNDNLLILNTPFTLRMRITETKNINEVAAFAGSVVDDANDDLTQALLNKLGLEEGKNASANSAPSVKRNPPGLKGEYPGD